LQEEETSSNKQTQPAGKLQNGKHQTKTSPKQKKLFTRTKWAHMMQLSKTPLSVCHVKMFLLQGKDIVLCLDSL
jgi:hypothetical protein